MAALVKAAYEIATPARSTTSSSVRASLSRPGTGRCTSTTSSTAARSHFVRGQRSAQHLCSARSRCRSAMAHDGIHPLRVHSATQHPDIRIDYERVIAVFGTKQTQT